MHYRKKEILTCSACEKREASPPVLGVVKATALETVQNVYDGFSFRLSSLWWGSFGHFADSLHDLSTQAGEILGEFHFTSDKTFFNRV
jgi:hypothetical protein